MTFLLLSSKSKKEFKNDDTREWVSEWERETEAGNENIASKFEFGLLVTK